MTATLPVMTRPARRAREQGKRTSTSQALLTRPEECVPLRSRLGRPIAPVKSLAGYPGRQLRAGGDGPCPSCRAPGRLDGHAGDEGSDERGGHGRLPAGRGREGRRTAGSEREPVACRRVRGGRQPDRVLLADPAGHRRYGNQVRRSRAHRPGHSRRGCGPRHARGPRRAGQRRPDRRHRIAGHRVRRLRHPGQRHLAGPGRPGQVSDVVDGVLLLEFSPGIIGKIWRLDGTPNGQATSRETAG